MDDNNNLIMEFKMETMSAKTSIIVNFENNSVSHIISTTIKALRRANKDKLACQFQREICSLSEDKTIVDLVKEYVIIL